MNRRDYMTVVELAERIGIERSNLHKRVRKAGVETIDIPVMTDGGIHPCKAVPIAWARELIALFDEARANAAAADG